MTIHKKYMHIIHKLKSYRKTHRNLANLWLAYLGLKKGHCDKNELKQVENVLCAFENGQQDIKKKDIMSLLLYKRAMMI